MEKLFKGVKEFAWPFGLLAGFYAIGTRFIEPTAQISLWLALAVAVLMGAIIMTALIHIAGMSPNHQRDKLTIESVSDGGTNLLVKKTEALGVGMGVNVYLEEDGFERMIAVGRAAHVQMDGRIQLSIDYLAVVEPALITRIGQNSKELNKQIIIRAGVIMPDREVNENVQEPV